MDQFVKDKIVADDFVGRLLHWNQFVNRREMPWKGEKDPYKIWLSEIILQQTRVEQGWNYYQQFIHSFPTVADLANAPEQLVFKHWEGLGYYSRCRNLIATAKYITTEKGGIFPNDYDSILALKGIGPYTAAAIASFAYELPYAVLDGNVFRVLSRIFGIDIPTDSTKGKKLFHSLAQKLLPEGKSAAYNQAIMDFGATICKPAPECASCFFSNHCTAFQEGKQQVLPVKEKKRAVKKRWLNYIILRQGKQIAIKERTARDVWQNLYEFLVIETDWKTSLPEILFQFEKSYGIPAQQLKTKKPVLQIQQRLSHQLIYFQLIQAELLIPQLPTPPVLWIDAEELKHYPFPKTLQEYITSHI